MLGIMSEGCWSFQLLCIIAVFLPLETQEYNHIPNGKQNRNEMEVLNRYNEMHTKDYGKFRISSCQPYDVSVFNCSQHFTSKVPQRHNSRYLRPI